MEPPIVFIVDDDPNNLNILYDHLHQAHFKVLAARDGASALEQMKLMKLDLILLDIVMPGMDGITVCRRLKANPETQDIPIIFMTALDDMQNKIRGFENGGVDYIIKPFNEMELLARVETQITLQQLRATLQQKNEALETKVQARTAELQAQQKERERLFDLVKQQSENLQQLTNSFLKNQQHKQDTIAHNISKYIDHNLTVLQSNLALMEKLTLDSTDPPLTLKMLTGHIGTSLELAEQIKNQIHNITIELVQKISLADISIITLSPREREVLELIARGCSSTDIADTLVVSQSTVRTYRQRIMQKLGVTDTVSLIKIALRHSLIPSED